MGGMVEGFEAKYKALQIPYPSDQGALQAIDAQAKEQEAAYKQFCADSAKNIAGIKTELAKWEAMKPVEEMNLEEALDAGLVGTTIKGLVNPEVPSMWPHTETWEEYTERLQVAEDEPH